MKYPELAEIFLYGDSTESFCICIAVPQKHAVKAIAAKLEIEGTHDELCQRKEIKQFILKGMNDVGK